MSSKGVKYGLLGNIVKCAYSPEYRSILVFWGHFVKQESLSCRPNTEPLIMTLFDDKTGPQTTFGDSINCSLLGGIVGTLLLRLRERCFGST